MKKLRRQRKLQLIVTRHYYPITLGNWYRAASQELKKCIGVGFSDVIIRSDGYHAEVYRLADEMNTKIKPAMIKYVSSKKFLKGLLSYKKEVDHFHDMIREHATIKEIAKEHLKVFPPMAVTYYVPNIFLDSVPKKNKKTILKKCVDYRKICHGIMDDFNAAVAYHLHKNKLPNYVTIDGKERSWMKKGFVCSKGRFLNIKWDDFLKKNNYYVENLAEVKQTLLKGKVSYKGKATGKVKIVLGPRDFHKVKKGDIIVCMMTQVNYFPLLNKVKAIVTDEGGITTHAAIISREMKIPCIMGTKIATKIFKDGDYVEIDANNGIVRKLR